MSVSTVSISSAAVSGAALIFNPTLGIAVVVASVATVVFLAIQEENKIFNQPCFIKPHSFINEGTDCFLNATLQVFRNLYKDNYQYVSKLSCSLDLEVAILSKVLRGYGLSKSELRKLRVFLNKKIGMSLTGPETAAEALGVFLNLVKTHEIMIKKEKTRRGEIVDETCEQLPITPLINTSIKQSLSLSLKKAFKKRVEPYQKRDQEVSREEVQLTTAPGDLIINVNRIRYSRRYQRYLKDPSDMKIEPSYLLKGSYFSQEEDQHYRIESFIVHEGGATAGHYTAYIKLNGLWYCCNDAQVTQISSDEALQVAQQASVYHLRKIPA
ncbi:MAG TPA: ubiquitin carboxyl-terminal hydrolase family protein [Chlamydiales bacterium]|nr:ubiquitin carboxyl-terminal hydrolase family protein [Chlamydiales bacterium]